MCGQPFHYAVLYPAEDFLRQFRFRDDASLHHGADVNFLDDYRHRRYLMRSKRLYTNSAVSITSPLRPASSPLTLYFIG